MQNNIKTICFIIVISMFIYKSALSAPSVGEFKKTVAFIFVDGKAEAKIPSGTAFFIGIPTADSKFANVYLVTAKHVIQDENKKWLQKIYLRMNTLNNRADFDIIPLIPSGISKNVFTHPDSSVDLVVILYRLDHTHYDQSWMDYRYITTEEDMNNLKITEGSEVFFTGLFYPYLGTLKNYPVVRFGKVALITDEKIKFTDYEAHLYLLETASYGGNSGSPVFFKVPRERKKGAIFFEDPENTIIKLAGIMSGTFLDQKEVKAVETVKTYLAPSNMGIAAVVPAYKLSEILFGNELSRLRRKLDNIK